MKIKYAFADETVEIEVSEEWGNILIDLDRQKRSFRPIVYVCSPLSGDVAANQEKEGYTIRTVRRPA